LLHGPHPRGAKEASDPKRSAPTLLHRRHPRGAEEAAIQRSGTTLNFSALRAE
jgi:hypothetical protein